MKRIISLILCFIMLVSICTIVYADCLETAGVDHEFLSFLQGAEAWGDFVYSPISTTNCTLRRTGCAVTSIAILMAYADPELRNVEIWNPYICAQTMLYFGGENGNDLASYDTKDPSFNYVGSWASRDKTAITNYIKDKLENGYYCMIWGKPYWANGNGQSTTHFSPVVGIDPSTDDVYVWDTTWADNSYHRFLDGTIDGSTSSVQVIYYESTKNSAKETMLLHNPRWGNYTPDGAGSGDGNHPGTTEEDIQLAVRSTVREWELNGMPTESDISCRAATLSTVGRENIGVHEIFNIQSINNRLNQNKKDILYYVRTFSVVIGLLLFAYALILWAVYMLDRSNSFIQLEFISLFTFGKLKMAKDDVQADEAERGYITKKGLYIRIAVILAIATLLISGVLMTIVSKLAYWISCS